ncbi:hypothetical protein Mapa_002745 [Marchantia paleacea]|nr:hypothetical protein Mapa_002745 [Marchantia paleacea]
MGSNGTLLNQGARSQSLVPKIRPGMFSLVQVSSLRKIQTQRINVTMGGVYTRCNRSIDRMVVQMMAKIVVCSFAWISREDGEKGKCGLILTVITSVRAIWSNALPNRRTFVPRSSNFLVFFQSKSNDGSFTILLVPNPREIGTQELQMQRVGASPYRAMRLPRNESRCFEHLESFDKRINILEPIPCVSPNCDSSFPENSVDHNCLPCVFSCASEIAKILVDPHPLGMRRKIKQPHLRPDIVLVIQLVNDAVEKLLVLGHKYFHGVDHNRNIEQSALPGRSPQRSKHEEPNSHVVAAEACHYCRLPILLGNGRGLVLRIWTVQIYRATLLPLHSATEQRRHLGDESLAPPKNQQPASRTRFELLEGSTLSRHPWYFFRMIPQHFANHGFKINTHQNLYILILIATTCPGRLHLFFQSSKQTRVHQLVRQSLVLRSAAVISNGHCQTQREFRPVGRLVYQSMLRI